MVQQVSHQIQRVILNKNVGNRTRLNYCEEVADKMSVKWRHNLQHALIDVMRTLSVQHLEVK